MMHVLTTAALCLIWVIPAAWAGIEEGRAAYERGDYETALRECRPLAARGDLRAQNILGSMYDFGRGVTQNYTKAAKWYRKAAEQGHVRSQYKLGFLYYEGRGVPQDHSEAVKWYQKGAEQGHVDAQRYLGDMYEYGYGLPQDYIQAHKWYNLAASQGNRDARSRRIRISRKMTPAQITKAQRIAREWWIKHFGK